MTVATTASGLWLRDAAAILARVNETQADGIETASQWCAIKSGTAELLVERSAVLPVISRPSAVGAERSRELYDQALREHARRLARALDQSGGG